MTLVRSALVAAAALALPAPGCKSERPVKVVWEGDSAEDEPSGPSEEELRKAFEEKKKARENAPEPVLDPNEPREKFELVWRLGGERLQSIYGERAEMIAMLRRGELEDKAWKAKVDAWVAPLTEFGIGREPASMEKAPAELCKLVTDVRTAADELIALGNPELEKLAAEEEALNAKQLAGEKVFQDQWDKIDKAQTKWSQPVRAGRQMLLVVKSLLEEGLVLAEHGPRRTQLALRDCLTEVAKKPIDLDIAQQQLEEVLARSRWYRDMR